MWPIKKYVENNYIIMKEHDRMRRGWGGAQAEREREKFELLEMETCLLDRH